MSGGRRRDFALEWPVSPGPEDRALDPDAAEASLDWSGHTDAARTPVKPLSRPPEPAADRDDGPPRRRLRVRVRESGPQPEGGTGTEPSVDELHALVAELRAEVAALRARVRQLDSST